MDKLLYFLQVAVSFTLFSLKVYYELIVWS